MSKKDITNNLRDENFYLPRVKDEPQTPGEEEFGNNYLLNLPFECDSMRKSLSMNDLTAMREDQVKYEFNNSSRDIHRYRRPTGQSHELVKTKFVSMAEAVYHYQRDTPGRFHSTRPKTFLPQDVSARSGLTIPQSPMLRSKFRSRPQHVLSQQEKEAMEIEELKNFKIKPLPIPKAIFEGPIHLPEVSRKPKTIPEPFNLTEIHKKLNQSPSPNPVLNFKARPAPKHILVKPQVPEKPAVKVTIPVSPKFHYKKVNPHNLIKNKPVVPTKPIKPQRLGPVRPEPFSFESLDEERKKRKEAKIRLQIEEEKKQASSFKAHPLPGVIKKRMQSTTKGSSSTTSSTSENKENYIKFEARPPVVLYKKPFKPVLQSVQVVKPMPFDLTTQKRAAEREKYDKQLKEKEEENERLRQEREKAQDIAEEMQQTELRAKLVHHAKPVPSYTAFVLEKSNAPLTIPETPNLIRRMKPASCYETS